MSTGGHIREHHNVRSVHVEPPVLSDHAFIVADIDLKFVHDQPKSVVRRRQWRKVDFDALREDLHQSSLLIDPPSSVAELFACYDETLKALVDKHAPYADVKLHAHLNAPWYDSRCQIEKQKTRRLERAYRRKKSEESFKAWRSQSQYLRFVLREQYTEYWSRTLSSNMKDPAALWSKIGVLINQPKATSDCKFSPDEFADFFQNKVSKIRLSTSSANPPLIEPRQFPALSSFRPVTAEEILKIVGASPAKHCMLDPAPTWLIKRLVSDLAGTITKMCNMSLEEGNFPNMLKATIVRPRLKKTNLDPEDLNSYRPISNLTFLSKTVERVVAIRFVEHAELHGLLPHNQSAYRSFHSTETAVLAVHNSIVRTIDSGKLCALVLLDLSAAFDTVDHPIMLQVLHDRFCVEDATLKWFESYLSDRTQTYMVKDQQSRPRTVDCSVPQGSVLGPQKFNAYTEDLANLIDDHLLDHHMYADDTQLIEYTTASNIPNAIMKLQNCVESIHEWCRSRRLQLNPAKTELIWFGSKASLKKTVHLDLNLYIGADVIKPVGVVRDLGVFLPGRHDDSHRRSNQS